MNARIPAPTPSAGVPEEASGGADDPRQTAASTRAIAAIRTLGELAFFAAEQYGDRPAQRFKRDGRWQDISHRGVAEIVDAGARGLIDLGIQAGDRVAILCETRPEWIQIAYAVAAAGGVVVPVYATNSPEECQWVLGDSGAVAVVCEDAEQVAKIDTVRDQLPELTTVVVIDGESSVGDQAVTLTMADLLDRGRRQDSAEREARTGAADADDPAIIIYTSGTTGRPKGCVLTHGNLLACARQAIDLGLVYPDDISYLFLPLAHVFAQTTNLMGTAVGLVVAYVSDGTASIMSDLQEVRPTYFPSVPRIFEKVYSAFAEAPRAEPVYEKVRQAFGGRVRVAITGAAPIAPEILEFFFAAGVSVYEGYGLSESTSYGTVNLPGRTQIGSVGPAMPFGEIKVAEDGELLLRGPHIFKGYWNNPGATADTMTEDGWLLTGDLGAIDDEGFITITGRKKEIIITAGGKNITPSEFENDLRQCPFVSYVVMHGDRRPFPVALVTLDPEYVLPWATAHGKPSDPQALASDPDVQAEIQAAIDDVNSRRAQVSQVKRFHILPADFSKETGELTATLKMKRSIIAAKYADVLDALYS